MISVLIVLAALAFPMTALADSSGMPLYLFLDPRYWLFVTLYVLVTVRIVMWVRRLADVRDEKRPLPLRDISWGAIFILGLALVYQMFHHYEHVSQIYQWWYLGQHKSVSKGVVFFLDLEWNHFIFDSGLFIAMCISTYLFLKGWKAAGHTLDRTTKWLIRLMIVVQGWHAVEHTYRIIKHVNEGCEPCSGIADQVFQVPLIPLHFWFNVLAMTLPLMLFVWLRMDKMAFAFVGSLKQRIKQFFKAPQLNLEN